MKKKEKLKIYTGKKSDLVQSEPFFEPIYPALINARDNVEPTGNHSSNISQATGPGGSGDTLTVNDWVSDQGAILYMKRWISYDS
ncbi:MAG TPA: hypothetical protein VN026_18335 [Bacteroidia bacterium]|jgi:hypothetical protein|nr:hypothetical protein [Bacteroidia bacterium]